MKQLLNRKIIEAIYNQLSTGNIIILIGARQTGKTSILKLLIERLKKQAAPKNIFYFDLEKPELIEIFSSHHTCIRYLELKGADLNQPIYLFIDEFQYIPEATKLFKIIHDSKEEIRIIASGSSALEIKRRLLEPLTGRKRIFYCHPLDFEEFLSFKKAFDIKEIFLKLSLNDNIAPFLSAFSSLYEEFLLFGAYPKIVLTESAEEKKAELNEIYNSYIGKDIRSFVDDEDIVRFNRLVSILASCNANLCNLHQLSNTADLSRRKVERYLFLLEQTFVIKLVQPFFINRQKEITKTPKIFFNDTGIVNSISGDFNPVDYRRDRGAMVETAVYVEFLKNSSVGDRINYWRTRNQSEVDFIVKKEGRFLPIEVKYQVFRQPTIPRSLLSFISFHNCLSGFVITKDYLAKREYNNCPIYFLPAFMARKILEDKWEVKPEEERDV